jgi:phasin family protein
MADKPSKTLAEKVDKTQAAEREAKPAPVTPEPVKAKQADTTPDSPVVAKAVAEPVAKPTAPLAAVPAGPVSKPAAKPAAKPARKPAPAVAPAVKQAKPVAPKPVAVARKAVPATPARTTIKVTDTVPAKTPVAATSIKDLKDKIMAYSPNIDAEKMTETVTAALGEIQTKAKVAYEKSTAAMTDMTEFAKGNVEAVVESGKILASGMQEMGKTVVEDAKSAYETATVDLKEMAAVKSPTDLFQLQGKIARRNFDAMVATGTKNSEMMMKMVNDMFAPLSGRVNVAVDKISKAA